MSRIYIAGPMRGRPELNYPAFNKAADLFRQKGWTVENPVDIGQEAYGNDPKTPPQAYLTQDLRRIFLCTSMALLPEWDHSTGARCEAAVAVTLGLEFYDALTGKRVHTPEYVIIQGGYERVPGPIFLPGPLAPWLPRER